MLMNDLSSSKFESLIKDKWALQNLKKKPLKMCQYFSRLKK